MSPLFTDPQERSSSPLTSPNLSGPINGSHSRRGVRAPGTAGQPCGHTRRAAAKVAGIVDDEFRPVGGESLRDMERRVQQVMRELMSLRGTLKSVLIISHSGPIAAIVSPFRSEVVLHSAIGNGSITVLDTDSSDVVTILAGVKDLAKLDEGNQFRTRCET